MDDAKKYAVVTVAKARLAKMSPHSLASAVDRCVRRSIRDANAAADEYLAAKRAVDAALVDRGSPASVAAFAALERVRDAALAKRDALNAALTDYLEEQRALFRSRGLSPERAYREAIVPTGEVTGTGVEVMRIVPRSETLEPVEEDDETTRSVRASRSYSDGIGLAREVKRGRYNDGHLLVDQSTVSIDPSERAEWSRACL